MEIMVFGVGQRILVGYGDGIRVGNAGKCGGDVGVNVGAQTVWVGSQDGTGHIAVM